MTANPQLVEARDRWLGLDAAARAVAGPRAIATCGEAVRELVERLAAMGFPVAGAIRPCPDLDRDVAALEAVGPSVPPALRAFWSGVGSWSLVAPDRGHVGFWADQGVRFRREPQDVGPETTDAVAIEGPVDRDWLEFMVDELETQVDEGWRTGYVLSADCFHKDDISGADPYLLVGADDPWMATVALWWCGPSRPVSAPAGDEPDLVSYLRSAVLEAGGFPGLLGDAAFERVRPGLVAGLPVF